MSSPVKLWLAVLFLVVFLLGSLVLLGQLRHRLLAPEPTAPVTVESPPPSQVEHPPTAGAERIFAGLVAGRDAEGGDRVFAGGESGWLADLSAVDPGRVKPAAVARELEGLPGVRVEARGGNELSVLWRGVSWGRVLLPSQPPPAPTGAGRVAIIVDDLGRDLATIRSLLAIDLPLSMAIIPGEPHAREAAELVSGAGHDLLIHIPMEPQGYPAVNPGDDALFVDQSRTEMKRRFQGYLKEVPNAIGGNNHMGSRFTEDRKGMTAVLDEMRGAGLFFIDSRTTGGSVGYDLARRLGVPTARRDVFLDNVQDEGLITVQIRKLARLARRRGSAIGICHPHPTTLAALRRAAADFREAGVEVVPVSRLVGKVQARP